MHSISYKINYLSLYLLNDIVDRAQFDTVLSRILWGTQYARGEPFYVKHLEALQQHVFMRQISNPFTPELRGRVMLMMQRISENRQQEQNNEE